MHTILRSPLTIVTIAMAMALYLTSSLSLSAQTFSHDSQEWRKIDEENTLVIDTNQGGRMIIEMNPLIAPQAVERIKMLSRANFYDGLLFHRVVPYFVVQTGNPDNKDGGKSQYHNLPPEMSFKWDAETVRSQITWVSKSDDIASGLLGSIPFQITGTGKDKPHEGKTLRGWGVYCTYVAGMGRDESRDSANSELFFMLAPSRRLDKDYTAFGNIIIGKEVLMAIPHGEPPTQPDSMLKVRVLADLPNREKPSILMLTGQSLERHIQEIRQAKGADFSVCDVSVPVKVNSPNASKTK